MDEELAALVDSAFDTTLSPWGAWRVRTGQIEFEEQVILEEERRNRQQEILTRAATPSPWLSMGQVTESKLDARTLNEYIQKLMGERF